MNEYIQNARKKQVLTKFLTVEEQKQLEGSKLNYVYSNIGNERKRSFISYDLIDIKDFNISVLKLNYNKKFYDLSHPMILGSLIGLGITRDCIGDIIIGDDTYIIVIKEMIEYIINNINFIDRAKVSLSEVDSNSISNINLNNYIETSITVASMRLDVLVSSITKYSREKAKIYITQKNVKVNGEINTNINDNIKIGDLLSIHRFGRTYILDDVRKTKKDKIVLLIKKTK